MALTVLIYEGKILNCTILDIYNHVHKHACLHLHTHLLTNTPKDIQIFFLKIPIIYLIWLS